MLVVGLITREGPRGVVESLSLQLLKNLKKLGHQLSQPCSEQGVGPGVFQRM